jgi:hypothetical protein
MLHAIVNSGGAYIEIGPQKGLVVYKKDGARREKVCRVVYPQEYVRIRLGLLSTGKVEEKSRVESDRS